MDAFGVNSQMATQATPLKHSAVRAHFRSLAVDRKIAPLFVLLLALAVVNAALLRHVLWDQHGVSEARILMNQVGALSQQAALQTLGVVLGSEDGARVQQQLRDIDGVLATLRAGGAAGGIEIEPLPAPLQAALQGVETQRDVLSDHLLRVLQEPELTAGRAERLAWHTTLMDDVTGVWQACRTLIDQLIDYRQTAQNRTLWQMYALLMLDVLVLLAAYGWMRQSLVRPLYALADSWRRLAAGDYQVRMAPTRVAEMNDVVQAFNASVERIGSLLAHTEESLWRQANYDELTGLANRYLFRHHLVNEIHRAQRSATGMTLLFLDLNLFKEVNDTYGHGSGDRVLQQVGKRLAACVREMDLVARLGGDEFTLVLSEVGERTVVERIAASVHAAVQAPFDLGDTTVHLSCSIGVAFYPEHGTRAQDLLHHADTAMYQAKRAGAGATVFYGDGAVQPSDGSGLPAAFASGAARQNA